MSSAGKSALEYLRSIYPRSGGKSLPDTQIWLSAIPGDSSRETGMESGAVRIPVYDAADVEEMVHEWNGRRGLYHNAARFDPDAPGPRIVNARAFHFAWLDSDLVPKPAVATPKLIDMVCNAMDELVHKPSVIVFTGGGVQALWHFPTPLLVGTTVGSLPAHDFIVTLNRELARVFGGDEQQCHPAGGLRLPYTVNLNRASVCAAGGGPPTAKPLRLEPERTCDPVALLEELAGFGVKLARTKDGHWSSVPAVLSKAERVHAMAARFLAGDGAKPAKSPDEWEDIKRALVLKGGRNGNATKLAGWLVRRGMSEDDTVMQIEAMSADAAAAVRAGGGTAEPLSRREIAMIVRNIKHKHERANA